MAQSCVGDGEVVGWEWLRVKVERVRSDLASHVHRPTYTTHLDLYLFLYRQKVE